MHVNLTIRYSKLIYPKNWGDPNSTQFQELGIKNQMKTSKIT